MTKLYISAEKDVITGEYEFEEFLEIAKGRDLGLEIQEFALPEVMHGDWKKRLGEYEKALRDFHGGLALHNAFLSLFCVSPDPDVVDLTRKKFDFHFMIAKELGCKIIVSHFLWFPFDLDVGLYRWQEAQVSFWDHYVNIAEKDDIYLVTENIAEPRPEILKPIIDKIDSERFKFILDIGHANLCSEVPIEDWIYAFGNDLTYMHVHNNYKNYDQHNSVLKGTVSFDYVFKVLDRLEIAPILSTEVFHKAGLMESLDYLEKKMAQSKVYGSDRQRSV